MRRLSCALTLLLLIACSSESDQSGAGGAGAGGKAGAAAGGSAGKSSSGGSAGRFGTGGGEGRPISGGSGGTSAGAGGELVSGGAAGDSGGPCLGDWARLSQDCLSTFDGTPAGLPPCDALVPDAISYWIYACSNTITGDTISYDLGSGFSSLVCTYDASTHALVGVMEAGDTPGYCDGQSFTVQAGKVPAPSCRPDENGTACGAAGAAGAAN